MEVLFNARYSCRVGCIRYYIYIGNGRKLGLCNLYGFGFRNFVYADVRRYFLFVYFGKFEVPFFQEEVHERRGKRKRAYRHAYRVKGYKRERLVGICERILRARDKGWAKEFWNRRYRTAKRGY